MKEGERVDLELKLTQVKENLKKSLAGGELGAPTEYLQTTNKVLTGPKKLILELSLIKIVNIVLVYLTDPKDGDSVY